MNNIDTFDLYNNETLPTIKYNFSEMIEAEKKYLYNLFECKEKINENIDSLEKKGLSTKEKELYDNLSQTKNELFGKFFKKFCKNNNSAQENENYITKKLSEDGYINPDAIIEQYLTVDEFTRKSFGKLIFNQISKDKIKGFFGGDIPTNKEFLELIPGLVTNFLHNFKIDLYNTFDKNSREDVDLNIKELPTLDEKLKQGLPTSLGKTPKCLMDINMINNYFDYSKYEDRLLDSITHCLSEQTDFNFETIIYSINLGILNFFNTFSVIDEYFEFYVKETYGTNNTNEVIDDGTIDKQDLYDGIISFFNETFGEESNLGNNINDINYDDICGESDNEFFSLIRKKLIYSLKGHIKDLEKFKVVLDTRDEEKIEEYIEDLYLENKFQNKFFIARKDEFIAKINKAIFDPAIIDISEDEKNEIIAKLKNIYPKAKSEARNITERKFGLVKTDFINQEKEKLNKKITEAIKKNGDLLGDLTLKELIIFSNLYVSLISEEIKQNKGKQYIEYVYDLLKRKFEESHNKIVAKEEEKELQKAKQVSKKGEMGKKPEQPKVTTTQSMPIEKKSLPKGLISELKIYFGGNLDQNLERSLKNCQGIYRIKRFKRFDVDEKFFKILEKYGFICEDEQKENDINEGQPTSENNNDGNGIGEIIQTTEQSTEESEINKQSLNKQLSTIKSKINEKKSLDDELISLYIKIFQDLGYEILIENNIKDGLQEVWSRINQLNSLLLKLINGGRIKKDPIFGGIKSNVFSRNFKTAYVLGFDHTCGKFIVAEEGNKKYLVAITKHGGKYDDKFSQ